MPRLKQRAYKSHSMSTHATANDWHIHNREHYKKRLRTGRSMALGRSTANKVSAIVTAIPSVRRARAPLYAEIKWKDDHAAAQTSNVGGIDIFSTIIQGTGQGQRIGDKIRVEQCLVNYRVFVDPSCVDVNNVCSWRLIFFQWQGGDTAPTVDDVLATAPAANVQMRFYNRSRQSMVRILLDKAGVLTGKGSTANEQNIPETMTSTQKVEIPVHNPVVNYGGTYGSNKIWMIFFSSAMSGAGSKEAQLALNGRVAYTDA